MRLSTNLRILDAPRKMLSKLPFPGAQNLRIAHLTNAICFQGAKSFPSDHWNRLDAFAPHVLIGSAPDLHRLARQVQAGHLKLSSIDHAVVVLTECGNEPVTDLFRVVIWQTFGVPVYELIIGPSGKLLASECEAHEGWHIAPHVSFSAAADELFVALPNRPVTRTGLKGRIESQCCPCGRPGTRLLNLEQAPLTPSLLDLELAAIA